MIDILLKVNEIFDNHINNIKGNFRQKILTIKDALLFRMKYAEIGVTKDTVAADINYEANINCDATVFTKKEKNNTLVLLLFLFFCVPFVPPFTKGTFS